MQRTALRTLDSNASNAPPSSNAIKKPFIQKTGEKEVGICEGISRLNISSEVPAPWIKKLSKSRGENYFFHPSLNKSVWENEEKDLTADHWHACVDFAVDNAPLPKHEDFQKGEDRFYMNDDKTLALVVDGVGGSTNRKLGVDAGKYASALCACFECALSEDATRSPDQQVSLRTMLHAAALQLHPTVKGTAVFAAARLNKVRWLVEICHLGDSQVLVLRGKGKVVHHTQPCRVMPPKDATEKHENGENTSGKANSSKSSVTSQIIAGMQLVALERKQTAGAEKKAPAVVEIPCQVGTIGEHRVGSVRREAKSTTLQVIPGDTIIIGSDGLFDNLCIEEIVSAMIKHENLSSREKAKLLTSAAKAQGRKPDDITVAVGRISRTARGPTSNQSAQ
jgi:serine/threonine protein phosphatase PrpC